MDNPTASTTPARDEVRRQIIMNLNEWGSDDPEGEADTMINAYAHELAEKIRAARDGDTCRCGGCDSCMADYYADLIDPQVTP